MTQYWTVNNADCKVRWESLCKRYRTERLKPTESTWVHRFDMAVLKSERNLFGRNTLNAEEGDDLAEEACSSSKPQTNKNRRKKVVTGIAGKKKGRGDNVEKNGR